MLLISYFGTKRDRNDTDAVNWLWKYHASILQA